MTVFPKRRSREAAWQSDLDVNAAQVLQSAAVRAPGLFARTASIAGCCSAGSHLIGPNPNIRGTRTLRLERGRACCHLAICPAAERGCRTYYLGRTTLHARLMLTALRLHVARGCSRLSGGSSRRCGKIIAVCMGGLCTSRCQLLAAAGTAGMAVHSPRVQCSSDGAVSACAPAAVVPAGNGVQHRCQHLRHSALPSVTPCQDLTIPPSTPAGLVVLDYGHCIRPKFPVAPQLRCRVHCRRFRSTRNLPSCHANRA